MRFMLDEIITKFAVFLEYELIFGSILLGHFIKHEPLISKEYSTSNVLKSNTQIDIRFFILQIYFCPTAKYDMDKKIAAKNSWNFCTSFVSGFHRGEFFYRKYAFVKVIIIQGPGQILVNSKSLKKELYEIKISQNLENSITKIYKPKNNFRFRNLRKFPSNLRENRPMWLFCTLPQNCTFFGYMAEQNNIGTTINDHKK